jgi:hypothetical protein
MTPAERWAMATAARNLRFALSRLDYINLMLKMGVRVPRIHDISVQELTDPS